MTSGPPFASPDRWRRGRALLALAGAAAAFLLRCAPAQQPGAGVASPQAAASAAPASAAASAAPAPAETVQPAPAPARSPGPDTWATLARCLRKPGFANTHVTVDQVRRWVEVDHLRAWTDAGSWWLPLSGEGTPRFASGLYAIVPAGDAPCSAAIVN